MSVVLATVLLVAKRADAQVMEIDLGSAIATTQCVRVDSGYVVGSIINMDALDSPNLKEYVVHEKAHQQQFRADSTLCIEYVKVKALVLKRSPRAADALAHWMPKLLKMEVEAYCTSAEVPIRKGALPSAVYLYDQELVMNQFSLFIEREVVMSTMFKQCGYLLATP